MDEELKNSILACLYDSCSPVFIKNLLKTSYIEYVHEKLKLDLTSLCAKDPSSMSDPVYVLRNYSSFSAVLHYRIANNIFNSMELNESEACKRNFSAFISQRGKLKSGAEIHYEAKIGDSFILDHGYGTVIGQTSEIGSNCYILGGVVLGAIGISDNPTDKRHPTIGNNVEIGANSSVLGNLKIGNNVFIGPNCTIIKDIKNNEKVINKSYKNQMVITLKGEKIL